MRHVDAVPREGLRRLLVVRNIFAIFTAVAQCGLTSCQVERTPAIGRRKGQSRTVGLFDRSQPSHRGRGREGTGAKMKVLFKIVGRGRKMRRHHQSTSSQRKCIGWLSRRKRPVMRQCMKGSSMASTF